MKQTHHIIDCLPPRGRKWQHMPQYPPVRRALLLIAWIIAMGVALHFVLR